MKKLMRRLREVKDHSEVAPIHPKAMPVILTSKEEDDVWLNAPTPVAMELQRPLRDERMQIVARGGMLDGAAK